MRPTQSVSGHASTDDMTRTFAAIAFALALLAPSSAGALAYTSGQIAFVSTRDGNEEIYVAAADGSNAHNVTQNPAADRNPAWSPDGTRIAFVSDRDGRQDLYVMSADGSNPTRITDGLAGSVDTEPSWSPDGTQLVFASTRPFNEAWHLWIVGADGSNLHQLTSGFGVSPDWSPDGTTIAYDDAGRIGVVGADGSNQRDLSFALGGVGPMTAPAWSADGRKLAFSVQGPPGAPSMASIFVADADGSNAQQITDWGTFDSRPQWSKDGSTLLYQRFFGPGNPLELFASTLDRSFQSVVVGGPGDNYEPSWIDPSVPPPPPPPPDTTPPTIVIRVPNAITDRTDTFTLGQIVPADYSCSDAGSGVRHCDGPVAPGAAIDTSSVGTKEFRVFAVDNAGNPTYRSAWYRVVFPFSGFASPVASSGWTQFRAGDDVPLRFSLGGDQGLGIVTSSSQQQLNCASQAPLGSPGAAATSLAYKASQNRYQDIWSTDKAWSGSCRSITLTLSDGTTHSALVQFTK
jgi:TolB protein